MTDKKIRSELYEELKEDIDKRDLSNSESLDKAILSLSSAGLAISLSFIKFIVPIEDAIYIRYLYIAWICFGFAIISTILSLMASQSGLDKQLKIAECYYLENNEDALEEKNFYSGVTRFLNKISGFLFITAIISVIVFSILNFDSKTKKKGDCKMQKNIIMNDGQSIPKIQKVEKSKGASIPSIQPAPQTQTPPATKPSDNSK